MGTDPISNNVKKHQGKMKMTEAIHIINWRDLILAHSVSSIVIICSCFILQVVASMTFIFDALQECSLAIMYLWNVPNKH